MTYQNGPRTKQEMLEYLRQSLALQAQQIALRQESQAATLQLILKLRREMLFEELTHVR